MHYPQHWSSGRHTVMTSPLCWADVPSQTEPNQTRPACVWIRKDASWVIHETCPHSAVGLILLCCVFLQVGAVRQSAKPEDPGLWGGRDSELNIIHHVPSICWGGFSTYRPDKLQPCWALFESVRQNLPEKVWVTGLLWQTSCFAQSGTLEFKVIFEPNCSMKTY